MKKISLITICIATIALLASCHKVRRSPGRAYMPDMSYSRAYETYAARDTAKFTDGTGWDNGSDKTFYSAMPVSGTVAKGDMLWMYPYKNDSLGYVQSASVTSPLRGDSAKAIDMKESERLYLIYCGICHGPKLDGNGPLWKDGNGPFPSAPKNFMGDDMKKMAEGTMFHSVTYGKNNMGSYASQLSTTQRWMVIAYIKSKQGPAAPATTNSDTATTRTK